MIRNVGLTAALNIYRAAIQFGLNIALAHFLSPVDFGLVALVLPITLFILLIGDFGLTGAIVSRAASPQEAGAAASLCQGFGVLIVAATGLLYGAGAFNGLPHPMAELLLAFAIVAMLAMLAIVPRAMLERRLRYGQITMAETAANTAAFIIAVIAAIRGAGAWSFACYHLTMQALRSLYFWHAGRPDIAPNTRLRLAVPLLRFGGWMVGFNLVNYLMRNLDRYIIGGWLGTGALGLYSMAYQTMLIPLMTVSWPVSGVLMATLSRLKDRPDMQRDAFIAMLMLVTCITFPMTIFVALKAELIFATILPAGWVAVGPLTARLAIAGGLQSATALIGALFVMSGRVREQFWMGVAVTLLTLTMQCLVVYHARSLPLLADAYVGLTLLLTIGYLAVIARLLGTRLAQVTAALLPAITLCLAASAAMLGADWLIGKATAAFIRLIIDSLAFGTTIAIAALIWRAGLMDRLALLQRTGNSGGATAQSA